MQRPAVQLFHTEKDPYELTNLAETKPEIVRKLRAKLNQWMSEQGDPGAPQDTTEALQAARQGKHLYRPK